MHREQRNFEKNKMMKLYFTMTVKLENAFHFIIRNLLIRNIIDLYTCIIINILMFQLYYKNLVFFWMYVSISTPEVAHKLTEILLRITIKKEQFNATSGTLLGIVK